jgi:hypothetical protein
MPEIWALFNGVSCPFRDVSQIREVPTVGRRCVSRNAKDLMLRSKFPGLRPKFAMPHCTNRFELYGFCAYPLATAQPLPAAYGIS